MSYVYDNGQLCMDFSNEEIITYLVEPLSKHPKVELRVLSGDEEFIPASGKRIEYVVLDGEHEDVHVSFYRHQTSIFFLNEEMMFIDDAVKGNYTSSDTYGNVVYEGSLRDKSHQEILELIYEMLTIVIGVKSTTIEETKISQVGLEYPKCEYKIKMTSDEMVTKIVKYANVTLYLNGSDHVSDFV
ncbi:MULTISPECIES: hypothetical protein [Paenibacillus]|uniref:hypothetical protein n=1 Tax=Paenibacillus TaxID=44249 RepID=UPI001F3D58A7|nr:hypothetical protein [Paenibacillus sp. JJ-223]CAH1226408.1 hypothetical protein PAECIP111890_05922 [Paenibacillus sp. JJ-223]